jgi:hypothetical protein
MTGEPVDERAAPILERLEEIRTQLGALAGTPAPDALTDPDPRTGERWDWGQVWAHVAEFPGYWLGQLDTAMRRDHGEPVPFGRVASDPDRIAAIERDRGVPPARLWDRTRPDLDRLEAFIRGLDAGGWSFRGSQSTLGVMDMDRILEEFLVGHLESHAAQLDGLLAG